MRCGFAIVPEGDEQPSAVFWDLEDAMAWANDRFGSESFRVQRLELTELPPENRRQAA